MQPVLSVRHAFYPLYCFSKACGYWPETYTPSKERSYTKLSIIYYTLLFALDLSLLAITCDPKIYKNTTNSSILNSGLWIQIVYSMFITIALMVLMATKRQQKWDFLARMQQIDETLHDKFHVTFQYALNSRYLRAIILFSMCGLGAYCIITFYYMWYLPFSILHLVCICASIWLSNLCTFAIFFQFISAVVFIYTRFNIINCLLEQMLFDIPFNDRFFVDVSNMTGKQPILVSVQPVSNIQTLNKVLDRINERTENILYMQSNTKRTTRFGFRQFYETLTMPIIRQLTFYENESMRRTVCKLTKLIMVHDELIDMVSRANDMFSLAAFLLIISIFPYITFCLFAYYKVWGDPETESGYLARINSNWTVMYINSVIMFLALNSSKAAALIVHRIMVQNDDELLIKKLSGISHVLLNRKVVIGFGLIVYDWPFFYTLLGFLVMVIVILIQFSV